MCLRLKQSNLVWLQVDVAIQTDSARVAATKAYHNYEVAFEYSSNIKPNWELNGTKFTDNLKKLNSVQLSTALNPYLKRKSQINEN